ncbi:MAG: 30S ribosomal protein S20, partial [Acidimicrobiia bacterium]|nr:30S ribosomal protein S20 [Acidimicrobiia bacterium]
RAVRAELKTREKAAEAAAGSDQQEDLLRIAIKRIDKAEQKGVLHKNTAARRKSRLIARVRSAQGASA